MRREVVFILQCLDSSDIYKFGRAISLNYGNVENLKS